MMTVTLGSAMNAADARPRLLTTDHTLRSGPVDTQTIARIIASSVATSAVETTDRAGAAPKYAATRPAATPPHTRAVRARPARRASAAIAFAIAVVVSTVNWSGTTRSEM